MPAIIGKYENGDTFARLHMSLGKYHMRIDVLCEGIGEDADIANGVLRTALYRLADEARAAAAAINE